MSKKASGITILLSLNRCKGPITISEGLRDAVHRACLRAKVNLYGTIDFRPFDDGTSNIYGGLTESHFAGGTYLGSRFAKFEVVMCNERNDNTEIARALAHALKEELSPADFDPARDWIEVPWESR